MLAVRKKLRARFGERHFDQTVKAYRSGALSRPRGGRVIANLLAVLVLAIPFLFIGGGLLLIWAAWPNWPAGVFGGLIVLLGAFLVPRRPALPEGLLRPGDLPATFDLIDTLCDRMKAPRVTGLAVRRVPNAYASQRRGEKLIGFNAILWHIASREERIAILAHEIGHLVNGDPLRSGLAAQAYWVLGRWHGLAEPQNSAGESLASEVVQIPLTLFIEVFEALLVRLTYPDSQRAEYIADAMAADVAGRDSAVSALETLELMQLAVEQADRFFGEATPDGLAYAEALKAAVREAPAERRAEIIDEMRKADHISDESHPPTVFRLRFLDTVASAADSALQPEPQWERIDTEWRPLIEQAAGDLRKRALVQ